MKHTHSLSSIARVEIRFSDCDPLGIVWHGNYVRYFEDGRESFSKKFGFDYMDFYNRGYSTPVVSVKCDFKKTMKYRDVALVETIFRSTEAAKIVFDYVIREESTNEITCTGSTTQVFVERDNMKLLLLTPDFIIDWKKANGL
jgi:acyl-CoA thioester hydrolase